MSQLVVGLGEVGAPLKTFLDADGWDLRGPHTTMKHYDILHIAFPFVSNFVAFVEEYQARWTPRLTVIHSTVPIGTTAKIVNAVHSPVNGRHGRMLEDLATTPKWFGGPRASEAADHWPGDNVILYASSDQTEALKLVCLVKFGAAVAAAFLADDVARSVGLTEDDLMTWDRVYNDAVTPSTLRRPLIPRMSTRIGGHCVVAGTEHLARTHPDPLLTAIQDRG